MTIVKGQIESLKRLKAELNQKGIQRFNSIGDIHYFLKSYEIQRKEIISQIEHDLMREVDTLYADSAKFQEHYDRQKTAEILKLNHKIDKLGRKLEQMEARDGNTFIKAFYDLLQFILNARKTQLEKNFNKIIHKKTLKAAQKVEHTNRTLHEYTTNRKKVISDRSLAKLKDLAYIREVVDSLYPLIAGAIGENLVVKELQKLSDKNILLNDFSIDFESPIYHRKERDRIFSIQIDHLLITNAGIFIIETKNWSQKSIENYDLRSPIRQIKRTSYALFVILNSGSKPSGIKLKKHHWGDKQIPIKNLVVMIHQKPREKFKYVEVKTLRELNNYISYFDPIFNDTEVRRIAEYLEGIKN